jgi:predicted oxidoreductase
MHHYDTSRERIIAAAEQALRHFHTDYLDLLLIHRPDPLLNADEVAAALTELRQAGKIRYAGVSNFMPFHWTLLQSRLDFPLITNQIEFSLTHLDAQYDGTLDQAQELRHPPMIWSPLGGGGLFTAQDDRAQRVRAVLAQIGAEVGGAGLDQVALAWVLAHPAQTLPVLGTGKLERIRAAAAAETIRLSRQQWFRLWEASTGHEVP